MPELPEVETVRRGLDPVLTGAVIARTEVRRPDLRWPFPPNMAARLTGVRVLALRRRSKYLLADLDSAETLLIHLGMSGRIVIAGQGDALGAFLHDPGGGARHDHVVFHLASGAVITFNDPRRFGAMDLTATAAVGAHRLIAPLGPEPLGNAFSAAHLAARFLGRRSAVKAALLDQRNVAGLGNIYVCEALWRARISPLRAAGRISQARLEDLARAVRETLRDAIAAGGSSLRDYRQADGALGYFQHSFAVYGRAGEACQRPGCAGIVRRRVQSARSSFYCPRCQR
ncbi:MAG: bifunctional DNA-formamidopyrimidine glycosylase/DNA-(apurinic or apyrimidinic site) lyase [Pseudomonadota bacterium]